jgi:hypothetical protein
MKWAMTSIILGIVLIGFGQIGLGGLFVVGGIGYGAFLGMKNAQAIRTDAVEDEVNPNDRYLITPIRKQVIKIEETIQSNPNNPAIKVIGAEALDEARDIYKQCVGLVLEKSEERRIAEQRLQAQKDVDEAQTKLSQSTTDDEKALYTSALDTNQKLLRVCDEKMKRFESIAANLTQAEAALKLMVSQLAAMAREGEGAGEADSELRASLTRLQTLGKSIGETDEFLENKTT